MNTPLDEIAFWNIVLKEAGRTIICEPHLEAQVKAIVDASALAGFLTVHASAACPEGKILVIDEQAIQASINEAMARPIWTGP